MKRYDITLTCGACEGRITLPVGAFRSVRGVVEQVLSMGWKESPYHREDQKGNIDLRCPACARASEQEQP